MKIEIVKLEKLSGARATIYSISLDDDSITLYERFVEENIEKFPKELASIREKISTIANRTGAIETFFEKPEGSPGQDVYDLRDRPKKRLRLYCMRLGKVAVILGGGGPKPKSIRKLQEDPKLNAENALIRKVSDLLTQKIVDDKEIWWSEDGMELLSDSELILEDDDPDDD